MTTEAEGLPPGFHQAFAAALWSGAPGLASADPTPLAALLAQPAFAVYRNTVMKACIDAPEASYPAVTRLVGSEWFRAVAARYVRVQPPRDGRLVDYGSQFAGFLDGFEPAAGLPYLAGVARLDRFWTEAHLAAGASPLAPQAIAQLVPEQLGAFELAPHPTARWVWFDAQPVFSIWARNWQGARPVGTDADDLVWQGEGALLTRPKANVIWRRIDRADALFLDGCAARNPISAVADAVLSTAPDADLASLFAQLLAAGAFAASASEPCPTCLGP